MKQTRKMLWGPSGASLASEMLLDTAFCCHHFPCIRISTDFGSLVSLFQGEPQACSLVRNMEQALVSSVRSVFTFSGAEGLQSIQLVPRGRATLSISGGRALGGWQVGWLYPQAEAKVGVLENTPSFKGSAVEGAWGSICPL